jgi:hypothetical protein
MYGDSVEDEREPPCKSYGKPTKTKEPTITDEFLQDRRPHPDSRSAPQPDVMKIDVTFYLRKVITGVAVAASSSAGVQGAHRLARQLVTCRGSPGR